MTQQSNNLVFFGSGPLAAQGLKFLIKHFSIELIITKSNTDKNNNPVKDLALQKKLKILYANNPDEIENIFAKLKFNSPVGVVTDYGVLIPKSVLNRFKLGIVNSHFSLLPEWRGADPITYALLSGQKRTGVSIMIIDSGMDTGHILDTAEVLIDIQDNIITLTNKLLQSSNMLLKNNLIDYVDGKLNTYKQPDKVVTYSAKINKNSGLIDFNKSAVHLLREIKTYYHWPQSWFLLSNKKIFVKEAGLSDLDILTGRIKAINSDRLIVGCKTGSLDIIKVKPEGKSEMDIKSFLNGYRYLISTR